MKKSTLLEKKNVRREAGSQPPGGTCLSPFAETSPEQHLLRDGDSEGQRQYDTDNHPKTGAQYVVPLVNAPMVCVVSALDDRTTHSDSHSARYGKEYDQEKVRKSRRLKIEKTVRTEPFGASPGVLAQLVPQPVNIVYNLVHLVAISVIRDK